MMRKFISYIGMVLVMVALVGGIFLVRKNQETRGKATVVVNLIKSQAVETVLKDLDSARLENSDEAALVILSNSAVYTPYLIEALDQRKSQLPKSQVVFLLGKMKSKQAVPVLGRMLQSESDTYLKSNIILALKEINDNSGMVYILPLLKSENETLKRAALKTTAVIGGRENLAEIRAVFKDEKSQSVLMDVVPILGQLKDIESVEGLLTLLNDPKIDKSLKDSVIEALGNIGDQRALTPLNEYGGKLDSQLGAEVSPREALIKSELTMTRKLVDEAIRNIRSLL